MASPHKLTPLIEGVTKKHFEVQLLPILLDAAEASQIPMMKLLVSTNDASAIEWLGDNCGFAELSAYASRSTVDVTVVTELLVRCMEHKDLLLTALSRRIATPSRLTSIISAASSFGSQRLMRYLLSVALPTLSQTANGPGDAAVGG